MNSNPNPNSITHERATRVLSGWLVLPIVIGLLLGAIALFIVLAIVMYVTRKVDWYARDAG